MSLSITFFGPSHTFWRGLPTGPRRHKFEGWYRPADRHHKHTLGAKAVFVQVVLAWDGKATER